MSPKRPKPNGLLEIATIAQRYFIDGKGKTEIAREQGMSRFRVARLLEQARDRGIVRISIVLPAQVDAGLSEELRSACRLHHARVVAAPRRPEAELRQQIGAAAATLLSELVRSGEVLGVAWGRTVDAMTQALTSLPRCMVVQLTGAAGVRDPSEEVVDVVMRLAALSGGSAHPIYAPLVLDTEAAATAVRRQPHVAETMRHWDDLTMAVVPVGTWDPPNSRLRVSLPERDRATLAPRRPCAEVCGMLIDASGRAIEGSVSRRTLAIRPPQWRRIPEVIAVAGGRSKHRALRAMLAGRWFTSLVTDEDTARALIASARERPI